MRKALTKSGRLTCPPRSACIRRFQLKGLSASFLIITVVATTLGCGSSGVKRDSPVAWILEGATLIDGTGAPPVPESVVVIEGDRIVKVGRKGDFGYPENHHITNLEGRYLLPGFIDMHAHVSTGPLVWEKVDGTEELRSIFDRTAAEQILNTLLSMGVTTVRNPGGPTAESIALRDSSAGVQLSGPTIVTAGNLIVAAPSDWAGFVSPVVSETEVREEVRRQAAAGVDFVKLYRTLKPELVLAGIDEAHAQGIQAVGHLGATCWTEAAAAGIDALVHGIPGCAELLPSEHRKEFLEGPRRHFKWIEFLDMAGPEIEELISVLVEKEVSIDPTLVIFESQFWGDHPSSTEHPELSLVPKAHLKSWRRGSHTSGWSEEDYRRGKAAFPKLLKFVKHLHANGVLLTAGTDTPNPWVIPGVSLHRELELLVKAGIPPLEVLKIGSYNGARALDILDERGSVEIGKIADLVVLTQNPLHDIRNTRKIESVLKDGKVIGGLAPNYSVLNSKLASLSTGSRGCTDRSGGC